MELELETLDGEAVLPGGFEHQLLDLKVLQLDDITAGGADEVVAVIAPHHRFSIVEEPQREHG